MDRDGTPLPDGDLPPVHARLVGAYWLDSPYLPPTTCCCAPPRSARPLCVTVVGLSCLVVTLVLAVTLA
ncbi:hypothetical protein ABZ626_13870 [Streptomyces longispororuber]|uniref:hypothetical protein n=1 Tax=Streptomyces TaxID=1883 RepID=UPI0024A9B377|nr:hypothetical protein [Streptomyces sp. CC224B]